MENYIAFIIMAIKFCLHLESDKYNNQLANCKDLRVLQIVCGVSMLLKVMSEFYQDQLDALLLSW